MKETDFIALSGFGMVPPERAPEPRPLGVVTAIRNRGDILGALGGIRFDVPPAPQPRPNRIRVAVSSWLAARCFALASWLEGIGRRLEVCPRCGRSYESEHCRPGSGRADVYLEGIRFPWDQQGGADA